MRWRLAIVGIICASLFAWNVALPQSNIVGGGLYGDVKRSSGGYTGPLDVMGTANTSFWMGLQCPYNTYSGDLADVWDAATGSTTETLLTCSSGGTINQTVHTLAVTCASGCNIATIYDTSGQTNCTSAACNLVQATNSLRPPLSQSIISGKLVAQCTGSTFMATANNFSGTLSQPFSMSAYAEQTSVASYGTILGTFDGGLALGGLFYTATANQVLMYVSSSLTAFASEMDGTFNAIQALFNNASSEYNVNGTVTGVNIASTDSLYTGAPLAICDTNSQPLTGYFAEGGAFTGDQSSKFATMSSNQATRW